MPRPPQPSQGGVFSYLLQVFLGLCAVLSLVYKRHIERPQRPCKSCSNDADSPGLWLKGHLRAHPATKPSHTHTHAHAQGKYGHSTSVNSSWVDFWCTFRTLRCLRCYWMAHRGTSAVPHTILSLAPPGHASAPWRSFSNQTADLMNAHTHTHAHAHARPRARAHTRTQPGISSTFSSTVRWASTLFMSCTRPYVTSPGGGMGVRLVCIPLVNTGVLRLRSSCGCGQYRFENGTCTHDANTNTSHHITSHHITWSLRTHARLRSWRCTSLRW